jgi:tRNA A37 methylthiotransferase MiaB
MQLEVEQVHMFLMLRVKLVTAAEQRLPMAELEQRAQQLQAMQNQIRVLVAEDLVGLIMQIKLVEMVHQE